MSLSRFVNGFYVARGTLKVQLSYSDITWSWFSSC